MSRSSKSPTNPNDPAAEIERCSSEEPTQDTSAWSVSEYLAQIGRKGGLKGGKARAAKLSARKRKKIARKAAQARWRHKK